VADDQWVVANRQVLEHPSSLAAVLKEPYWPASFGGVMWRPAVITSWALDYRVSSSPHWFHAVNILWAAIATALFALVACELAGPAVGLIVGVLFAVHPVHVEAVANVVGRAELMAAAGFAKGFAGLLVVSAVGVALLAVYNQAAFGNPFVTTEQAYQQTNSLFSSFSYPLPLGLFLDLFCEKRFT